MRQPRNVLVYPFRVREGEPEYAVFRRADDANWQAVSGGVEDDEDLATAARRETLEETGWVDGELYALDMVGGVQRGDFAAHVHWPPHVYIVTKHFFGLDLGEDAAEVALSHEHREARWCGYDEAYALLRYDDDRTALWELNERLTLRELPPASPR